MQKTSIRFYNGIQVRAVWVDDTNDWWYSATDLIAVLTESKNPRIYWNTLKTRNPQMNTFCRQLKLTSKDGKKYLSDVLNEQGIIELLYLIPSKNNSRVQNWIKGMMDPIDEKSKRKAYDIFEGDIISNLEVGTFKGLQQIHSFIFGGLYEFAGQLREKNISKGGFVFGNCLYLKDELKKIDKMPEDTIKNIVDKYVEMNIAHPFMEGNGRATRIWLDVILKNRFNQCVDWSLIDKNKYLHAMERSPYDSTPIYELIYNALTSDINNRELFMKGIDYSYYYEEIE